jgi:omega-6 fatty acid desaturase (delta-12 desaturase)
MSSLDKEAVDERSKPAYGRLLDTYGNEFVPPDFTIKDIRDAIPKHCFVRSPLRGYSYIARDLLCLATVFYLFHTYVTAETVPSAPLRFALWAAYGFVQGLFGTGLWVIAHECGHQAFSPYRWLNDVTGWTLHSALLVPYFSWKMSHSKHHKATGHMERDMVFLPRTREQHATRIGRLAHELSELTEETPIATLLQLVIQQVAGWPNYLLTNVTGHDFHHRQREGRGRGKKNGLGGGVNHFDPRSPLYDERDAKYILLSDLGLLLAGAGLAYLGNTFGWWNMAAWYFVPYLWVNHWLGEFPSLLQPPRSQIHSDGACPHLQMNTPANRVNAQSPSPSSSTRTPPSPTTRPTSGTLCAAPPPPSTAIWASSATTCSTASPRPMCCTTT